jgi:hypothetical protein
VAPLLVDGAARLRLAELGIEENPALRNSAVARGQLVITVAGVKRGQALGGGLGQDGLGGAQGCRNTRDPLQVCLGELLEVDFAIEGAICHQRGHAIGGLPRLHMGANGLAKGLGITAIATERLHQDRKACLMLHHQLPHDLVQVRPMIPAVPPGDVHHLCFGLFVAVVASIDMKARAIPMAKAGRQPQALSSGRGYQAVEFSPPRGIEGLQGSTEGLIVELLGSNTK